MQSASHSLNNYLLETHEIIQISYEGGKGSSVEMIDKGLIDLVSTFSITGVDSVIH